jgi:hypothetical protein
MNENTTERAEKRYLSSWKYNAANILTELETIVKNNGGVLCRTWEYSNPPAWLTERKQFLIVNRSISEAIYKEHEILKRLERLGKTEAARETREKIAGYEAMNNDPVLSYYGDYLYIHFVLDNYFYSFSMDDNPFFDFHFARVKIEEGNKINRNYYLQTDSKKWWDDCFWRANCSSSDIREAANLIYNMLLTADNCRTYAEKNRKPYTNIILLEDQS